MTPYIRINIPQVNYIKKIVLQCNYSYNTVSYIYGKNLDICARNAILKYILYHMINTI